MRRTVRVAVLMLSALSVTLRAQTTPERANPFLTASKLPYHAVPFDRIRNGDYQPAIEEGIRQEEAAVQRIASQKAPAT